MIKTPDQDCAIVAKSQKHACYPAYLNLQLLHPPGVCSYVLYSSSLYQVQTGRICRPVGHHDASLPRFVDVLYRLYHLSIHGFIPDPHIPLSSPLIADPYPHGQDLKPHNHKRPHVPAPPIPHYFSKLPDCHSISPLISFCFRYVPVFQYIRHSAHRQNSFLSSTLPLHPPTSPPSSYHYPIFASHPLGKPKPGNEQFAGSVLASMVSRCLSPRRDRLVMLILGE